MTATFWIAWPPRSWPSRAMGASDTTWATTPATRACAPNGSDSPMRRDPLLPQRRGGGPPAAPPARGGAPAAKARATKLSYKETRELAEIESTILAAEAEVTRLEQELNDPGLYRRDATKATQLGSELAAARERVSQLMDRWQELESKRE